MLCRPRVVTLVIALLLLAACGFAQNEGGLNNFDFSLPGARGRASLTGIFTLTSAVCLSCRSAIHAIAGHSAAMSTVWRF
jgi:hypothetical protein